MVQLKSDFVIGLSDKSLPLNKLPGFTKKSGFSIGYKQNGQIIVNKVPIETGHSLKEGDTIGCGVNYVERRLFFTIVNNLKLGFITIIKINNTSFSSTLSNNRNRRQKFTCCVQFRSKSVCFRHKKLCTKFRRRNKT